VPMDIYSNAMSFQVSVRVKKLKENNYVRQI
jgi:hypothetical protein